MLNDELERIYREANGFAEGKRALLTTEAVFAAMRAAVIAEREACAKVCDDYWDAIPGLGEGDYANGRGAAALDCAQAIRARANA